MRAEQDFTELQQSMVRARRDQNVFAPDPGSPTTSQPPSTLSQSLLAAGPQCRDVRQAQCVLNLVRRGPCNATVKPPQDHCEKGKSSLQGIVVLLLQSFIGPKNMDIEIQIRWITKTEVYSEN